MAISAEEFGKAIVASGVLSGGDIERFLSAIPTAEQPVDGETYSKVLVDAGKLTEFQARQILVGNGADLVLGEYVLLDRIGAGGMGQVFKAHHRRMKRVVAVKLLPPERTMDDEANRRFQREVEAAARLVHPNIVVAYDAGEAHGRHFLVMEYVAGRDLSAVVKARGALIIEQALDYITQAARGLAFAHGKGVVHRDVKPSNLLLNSEGTVKVLDLGLARFDGVAETAEEDLTHSGEAMGTADYMAPEQGFDTHHADTRSDIYALGCTLFRLLTAQTMFKANTFVSKVMAHHNSPIPDLRALRPDVSPQLDMVFRRMVAKKPEERYQTMNEVVAALNGCRIARPSGLLEDSDSNATRAWNPAGTTVEDPKAGDHAPQEPASLRQETVGSSSAEAATDNSPRPRVPDEQGAEFSPRPPVGDARGAEFSPRPYSGEGPGVRASSLRTRTAVSSSPPRYRNRRVLIATGAAGLIMAGIVFIIKDKYGKEITRVEAPDGSTVGMEPTSSADSPKSSISNLKSGISNPKSGLPPPSPMKAPFDAKQARAGQEAWAKHLGVPVEITNSIGMKLVLIPPGEFEMGSTKDLIDEELKTAPKDNNWYLEGLPSEGPRHHVRITRAFYLGMYLVTQEEYQGVMGTNPSEFSATGKSKDKVAGQDTKRFPVENVSWQDTDEFCSRLSEMAEEKSAGRRYRLPSEAQWEYACRAGTTGRWYFSPASDDKKAGERVLPEYAWYGDNSGGRTHAVGGRRASPWGLYDMYGNVWEWCQGWYAADYYGKSPVDDPAGPPRGARHVLRGGPWSDPAGGCRSAHRYSYGPGDRSSFLGFRVSQVLAEK